jgi:hypothetical protein
MALEFKGKVSFVLSLETAVTEIWGNQRPDEVKILLNRMDSKALRPNSFFGIYRQSLPFFNRIRYCK